MKDRFVLPWTVKFHVRNEIESGNLIKKNRGVDRSASNIVSVGGKTAWHFVCVTTCSFCQTLTSVARNSITCLVCIGYCNGEQNNKECFHFVLFVPICLNIMPRSAPQSGLIFKQRVLHIQQNENVSSFRFGSSSSCN